MDGSSHVLEAAALKCFVSHKCEPNQTTPCVLPQSVLGQELSRVFQTRGVHLIIDPFGAGIEVGSKIQTLELQAFLWLLCPGSLRSKWCRKERETAQHRHVPIFVIRLASVKVPVGFRGRITLDRFALGATDFHAKLAELAEAVQVRADLYSKIGTINPASPPELQEAAAQDVADHQDRTAVAEFIQLLDAAYSQDIDTTARYWIAVALGRAGSRAAVPVLEKWRLVDDHPLAQEGIREALSWLIAK